MSTRGLFGAEGPPRRVPGRGDRTCGRLAAVAKRPEDLDDDERARLSRAHHRLRVASQALEALTASLRQKGRWDPQAPTDEALDGARNELRAAWDALWRTDGELLG